VAVLIGAIVWWVERGTPAPVAPDMANPGAGGAAPPVGGASAGAAPDISRMSPRERFDRLFNRVMSAADRGDSATAASFTPMALGAYAQVDTVDADARYHAALLMLQVGRVPGAIALADSIEKAQPGHLFAYLIRGAAADLAQNGTMRRKAYHDFLQHYPAEERANRPEYREHRPAIDAFREKAEAGEGGSRRERSGAGGSRPEGASADAGPNRPLPSAPVCSRPLPPARAHVTDGPPCAPST
jgi:hypothetical protein